MIYLFLTKTGVLKDTSTNFLKTSFIELLLFFLILGKAMANHEIHHLTLKTQCVIDIGTGNHNEVNLNKFCESFAGRFKGEELYDKLGETNTDPDDISVDSSTRIWR